MYQQATAFQTRPSEVLGIRSQWLAWQFDRAIFLYGRTVENKANERDKKGKLVRTLEEALGYSYEEAMARKLAAARAKGRALRRDLGLVK